MKSFFKFCLYIFFMFIRVSIIGAIPILIGINYLPVVTPALGANNIIFMALYFSFFPTFIVVMVESFLLLNKLSKRKNKIEKDKNIYKLK